MVKRVALIIADGSEEIEAITPADVIRRAGAECVVFSVSGEYVRGSHGIVIKADKLINQLNMDEFDAVVIPGGMPGAVNIAGNSAAVKAIARAAGEGKTVAAICASPAVVLEGNGLLKAEKATCYPAPNFISALGEKYTGNDVESCGNFITANGPRAAMAFSLEICKKLGITPGF